MQSITAEPGLLTPWPPEMQNDPVLTAQRARIRRYVEEHIAKGNKPDFEASERNLAALRAHLATLSPTGRTEQEDRELIARYCPRRSFFR